MPAALASLSIASLAATICSNVASSLIVHLKYSVAAVPAGAVVGIGSAAVAVPIRNTVHARIELIIDAIFFFDSPVMRSPVIDAYRPSVAADAARGRSGPPRIQPPQRMSAIRPSSPLHLREGLLQPGHQFVAVSPSEYQRW